ncbi:surface polymer ligase WaaL domain protein, partial [Escherichia coli PA39]
MTSTLFFSL